LVCRLFFGTHVNTFQKLQEQITLGIQDDFYKAVKRSKGGFRYTLNSNVIKILKSTKNQISLDNKLTAIYLFDRLLNFEKRLDDYEFKQRKYKKKVRKLMVDLYDPSVETNVDIKSRLESELIEEPAESQLASARPKINLSRLNFHQERK
jgi:hypothetical protein